MPTVVASLARLGAVLMLALAVAACGRGGKAPDAKGGKEKARSHLVEAAAAEYRELAYSAVRTGTLRAREEVKVFNQEEGRIIEIAFYEGDTAPRDAVLVRLDDTLLRAQAAKAAATRRQATQDLKRLEDLAGKRLAAEDELARAETALEVARAEERLLAARLDYTLIRAPFDALITARLVSPGDVVPRYTHLLSLMDPRTLITEVAVSELLLPSLKTGDGVGVRIDALGDRHFAGRIARIHPTVDARTRQGIVEVALEPVPEGARAGQLCRVTLRAPESRRLVIPFAALRRDTAGEYVYRIEGDGKARRTAVRSGLRPADQVEVLEGLEAGDRVVTKGFLGLADGTAVTPVARD